MTFTRMDQGTVEDLIIVGQAVNRWQSFMPQRVKSMLLQLEERIDGYAVNQLQHSLQTATRALRDGASEELIVAALCHDIGATISIENHSAISAEILKPYFSHEVYQIVRTHQDFQRHHYHATMGRDLEARRRYINESWYKVACRFSDEWDQTSFDPSYDTLPLEHFEPMIERIFKQPGKQDQLPHKSILTRGWARFRHRMPWA